MDQRSAPPDGLVVFGPFTLDLARGRLLRRTTVVPLRRKALEVLRHLASRRGAVVPNEELLNAVWPGVHVTPQTLTNIIHELRIALDDPARAPRFLHTLHRQGHVLLPDGVPVGAPDAHAPTLVNGIVVGRDDELRHLEALWQDALGGRTRVAFVTGEPGIGKTTLVDTLVRTVADTPDVRIARGTCVEQHGQDEAYVPILGAIDDLIAREGPDLLATLRRSAPTWLVQMPWRLSPADHARLERALLGTTAARMLREGLTLLATLATTRPLLLVLEDLHWSDLATVDFVAALARRRLAAPLLVLGTYRQVDAAVRAHPLLNVARDLRRTGATTEVVLPPFDVAAVRAYLAARFGPGVFPTATLPAATLPAAILERLVEHSAGNPLFLCSIVDQLVARASIVATDAGWELVGDPATLLLDLPQSLRDFVLAEVAAMDPETREVVEAASVVGLEFTAPEVATTIARAPADVEGACEAFSRLGRIFRVDADSGTSDRVPSRRYAFVHAAHRRIAYEQIGPVRRQALHLAAAHGLLAAAGSRTDPVAARIALHYERGGDVARAIDYFDRAAIHAERRFAYRESAAYLRAALSHLDGTGARAPQVRARSAGLLIRLGGLLAVVAGYAAPETEEAFHGARLRCSDLDEPQGLFMAEMALCRLYLARAEITRGAGHSDRMLALARSRVPELTVLACCWAGYAASSLGDLPRARALLEEAAAAPAAPGIIRHHDVHRMIGSQLALVLAVMGDPTARAIGDAALARSVAGNRWADLVHALVQAAEHAAFVRDPSGHAAATQAVGLARESEIPTFLCLAQFYEAALDETRPGTERLAGMQEAVAARHAFGDRFQDSVLLALIAELQIELGDHAGAAATLDRADVHVAESNERHHEPELLRLRGALTRSRTGSDPAAIGAAATYYRSAVELAAARHAALWELRAARALAELPLPEPERAAARASLAATLARFPAELTSHDVVAARRVPLGSA